MSSYPDNEANEKAEAADNERRLSQKGWPVLVDGEEVMVVRETLVQEDGSVGGTRYLEKSDGSGHLVFNQETNAWEHAKAKSSRSTAKEDS